MDKNGAAGFAFFVNQHLTLGNRRELEDIAQRPTEIFHVERLRHILDSPTGYGLRLEYLGRAMTVEEQAAWVRAVQQDFRTQTEAVSSLLEHRTIPAPGAPAIQPSSILNGPDIVGEFEHPSSHMTAAMLCVLHRTITRDGPAESRGGRLRTVQVWIGTPERPVFEPPPPEAVPERLEDLLVWWRTAYADLSVSDQETIIRALARLHHDFVSIHPFEDGNGRMARLLIDLAAEELLGRRIGPALHADASRYFEALRSADQGDLKPLASIVADALAPPA